jgi:hypothetical protein
MEDLRSNRSLSAALTAVTASVVDVILNLAIWFAIHVVWTEVLRIEAGLLSIELPVLGCRSTGRLPDCRRSRFSPCFGSSSAWRPFWAARRSLGLLSTWQEWLVRSNYSHAAVAAPGRVR